MIIGKAVPGPAGPALRPPRRRGPPSTWSSVKTDKLSAKFGDWIEKDLLKMNPWDIKQVCDPRLLGRHARRGNCSKRATWSCPTTTRPNRSGSWSKTSSSTATSWVAGKLAADEELNIAKLDEMKTALDNLKIVDVRRKPAGLSADLKADADFLANPEARRVVGDAAASSPPRSRATTSSSPTRAKSAT